MDKWFCLDFFWARRTSPGTEDRERERKRSSDREPTKRMGATMKEDRPAEFFTVNSLRDFISVFPELVNDVTTPTTTDPRISESVQGQLSWVNSGLSRAISENVPNGKKLRGLMTFLTVQLLSSRRNKNKYENNLRLAKIIGWSIEFMQAYALIIDDIMDESLTRRGKTCWYLNPEVGLAGAIADASMIYEAIFTLIYKHFQHDPKLASQLVKNFHRMTQLTWQGQSLESRLNFRKTPEQFTMETYRSIAELKTSYYSFYFPIYMGITLANFKDQKVKAKVGQILLKIGHLFQVQDDFLDCFGVVEVTKKIGTDIQDGKCTWLLVSAIELSNEEQLHTLKANIGSKDEERVQRVKNLYDELELDKKFRQFEQLEFESISKEIKEISHPALRQLLSQILNINYKRQS